MALSTGKFQAGIDLGTTNSAIAVLSGQKTNLQPIGGGDILLPSSVYFDPSGKILVGKEAKNQILLDKDINGHSGFKRRMGQDYKYPIEGRNINLLPEELSGLVLRKLKEVYRDNLGEELHTAIVTVPARFKMHACDATRIAAMANYQPRNGNGLVARKNGNGSEFFGDYLYVETLMEPIAASLAYGISNQVRDNSSWLVYDLGGGTFDAVVVHYVDGNMNVRCSSGDEYLGGRDFDRKLYDYVKGKLQEQYDLKDFDTNPKYRVPRAVLWAMVEDAKILLSDETQVFIAIPRPEFTDNKGKTVHATIPITREKYNTLVGPDFQRTIDIVSRMLQEHKIAPRDLDRVILVGGPTKYPYFRTQIKDQLGIPIDTSVNPMTAIAEGAAIKAASTKPPLEAQEEIKGIINQSPHDCKVHFDHYDNPTKHESAIISGKLSMESGNENIDSIAFQRTDKGWESGNLPVNPDGTFIATLYLRDHENEFKVRINGKHGMTIIPSQPEVHIYKGVGTTDITPYSVNVTTVGGNCTVVIPKGVNFVAEGIKSFYTTEKIKKNSTYSDFLQVLTQFRNSPEAAGLDTLHSKLKAIQDYEVSVRNEKGKKGNGPWDSKFQNCKHLVNELKDIPENEWATDTLHAPLENLEQEIHSLQKLGTDYGILFVEVTEGESSKAADNVKVGVLIIPSTELRRDLPVDTEVIVEIQQTADRIIKASCFIPSTKQTFNAVMEFDRTKMHSEDLVNKFDSLQNDLKSKTKEVGEYGDESWKTRLSNLKIEEDMNRIKGTIDRLRKEKGSSLVGALADEYQEAGAVLSDAKNRFDQFSENFRPVVLARRLEFLDSIKQKDGEISKKMPGWRQSLANYSTGNAPESINQLENELSKYDKEQLGFTILLYLFGFSLQKQKFLQEFFYPLMEKLIKEYGSNPLILLKALDNILIVKEEFDKLSNQAKLIDLDRIINSFPYEMRGILTDMIKEDDYSNADFIKAAKIINKYDSPMDKQILNELRQVTPNRKVIQLAKKASVLWYENKLEELQEVIDEFAHSYMFIDLGELPGALAEAAGSVLNFK